MTHVWLLHYGEDDEETSRHGEKIIRVFATKPAATTALVAHLAGIGADAVGPLADEGTVDTDEGGFEWHIWPVEVEE